MMPFAFCLLALAVASGSQTPDLRAEPAAERRHRLEAECARNPGWVLTESKEYWIVTDVKDAAQLEELKRRLDALHALLVSELQPAGDKPVETDVVDRSVVRLFENDESFRRSGGQSAGAYDRTRTELVVPASKGAKRDMFTTLQSLQVGEYLDTHFGDSRVSPWFSAGLTAYYGGFEYRKGKFEAAPGPWHAPKVRAALEKEVAIKVEELIALETAKFYGAQFQGLAHAQSWSLIWFLRQGQKSKSFESAWAAIVPRYLAAWAEKHDAAAATRQAFEGLDIGKLEAAWKQFAEKMR